MSIYKHVAIALITSPATKVAVACLKDDPDTILGYSIYSADLETLHWVYVKKAWRNRGIAKSLTPGAPRHVSHLTDIGRILLHKLPNTTFNPFLIKE